MNQPSSGGKRGHALLRGLPSYVLPRQQHTFTYGKNIRKNDKRHKIYIIKTIKTLRVLRLCYIMKT